MEIKSATLEQFRVVLNNLPDFDRLVVHTLHRSTSSFKYSIPFTKTSFIAASCNPPTPIQDLDRYSADIGSHHARITQIINATPANSLVMGPFAQAANSLTNYVNSMPDQFCIGPQNQAAFDRLNATLSNAINAVRQGTSMFEVYLDRFSGQATPLLNLLYNASIAINSSSRDFTQPMSAAQRVDGYVSQFQFDVWSLSSRIDTVWGQFVQLFNSTDAIFKRAVFQIETNVEAEAKRFVDQQMLAEAAFRHWDTVDGKQGYDQYVNIMRTVAQTMIPDFNAFLQKVPGTTRIRNAATQTQQSVNQIDVGFNSFPNFRALPSESANFPHSRYGSDERKYGGDAVINALAAIARAYHSRTGKKLYMGDMQYEHGGKMGIHRSHKNGIDADVDGVEIGDVPNHDAAKALALAKEVLSAGAQLVFYASQTTVTDANAWAAQNGIAGRLQVEANHTKHFHLRMAP